MTSLRQEREALGLSQADVAEQVGVHRTTYIAYEQGGRMPSLHVAHRISRVIGKPVLELWPDPGGDEIVTE